MKLLGLNSLKMSFQRLVTMIIFILSFIFLNGCTDAVLKSKNSGSNKGQMGPYLNLNGSFWNSRINDKPTLVRRYCYEIGVSANDNGKSDIQTSDLILNASSTDLAGLFFTTQPDCTNFVNGPDPASRALGANTINISILSGQFESSRFYFATEVAPNGIELENFSFNLEVKNQSEKYKGKYATDYYLGYYKLRLELPNANKFIQDQCYSFNGVLYDPTNQFPMPTEYAGSLNFSIYDNASTPASALYNSSGCSSSPTNTENISFSVSQSKSTPTFYLKFPSTGNFKLVYNSGTNIFSFSDSIISVVNEKPIVDKVAISGSPNINLFKCEQYDLVLQNSGGTTTVAPIDNFTILVKSPANLSLYSDSSCNTVVNGKVIIPKNSFKSSIWAKSIGTFTGDNTGATKIYGSVFGANYVSLAPNLDLVRTSFDLNIMADTNQPWFVFKILGSYNDVSVIGSHEFPLKIDFTRDADLTGVINCKVNDGASETACVGDEIDLINNKFVIHKEAFFSGTSYRFELLRNGNRQYFTFKLKDLFPNLRNSPLFECASNIIDGTFTNANLNSYSNYVCIKSGSTLISDITSLNSNLSIIGPIDRSVSLNFSANSKIIFNTTAGATYELHNLNLFAGGSSYNFIDLSSSIAPATFNFSNLAITLTASSSYGIYSLSAIGSTFNFDKIKLDINKSNNNGILLKNTSGIPIVNLSGLDINSTPDTVANVYGINIYGVPNGSLINSKFDGFKLPIYNVKSINNVQNLYLENNFVVSDGSYAASVDMTAISTASFSNRLTVNTSSSTFKSTSGTSVSVLKSSNLLFSQTKFDFQGIGLEIQSSDTTYESSLTLNNNLLIQNTDNYFIYESSSASNPSLILNNNSFNVKVNYTKSSIYAFTANKLNISNSDPTSTELMCSTNTFIWPGIVAGALSNTAIFSNSNGELSVGTTGLCTGN